MTNKKQFILMSQVLLSSDILLTLLTSQQKLSEKKFGDATSLTKDGQFRLTVNIKIKFDFKCSYAQVWKYPKVARTLNG